MEFCPLSLRKLIEKEKLTESTIKRICSDISMALQFLHSKNCAHLDIKPENILKSFEGNFKLSDFGFSRFSSCDDLEIEDGDSRYLAPEMLDMSFDISKADIFSLGITLYEIMENISLPLNGEYWHELRSNKKSSKESKFSPNLKNLIESMMLQDFEKRPSASDILKSIESRNPIYLELRWQKIVNTILKEKLKSLISENEIVKRRLTI